MTPDDDYGTEDSVSLVHNHLIFKIVVWWTSADKLLLIALRAQEPRVMRYLNQLESLLSSTSGTPINVTEKLGYYVFDVMGSVNFGFSFNMLDTGKQDPVVEVFKKGMFWMGPFTPVPFLFHIVKSIPGAQKDWFRFRAWGDRLLQDRLQVCNVKWIYHQVPLIAKGIAGAGS